MSVGISLLWKTSQSSWWKCLLSYQLKLTFRWLQGGIKDSDLRRDRWGECQSETRHDKWVLNENRYKHMTQNSESSILLLRDKIDGDGCLLGTTNEPWNTSPPHRCQGISGAAWLRVLLEFWSVNVNKGGERTVPCGVPVFKLSLSDRQLPTQITASNRHWSGLEQSEGAVMSAGAKEQDPLLDNTWFFPVVWKCAAAIKWVWLWLTDKQLDKKQCWQMHPHSTTSDSPELK